jgi:hypothetical protein
LYFYPAVKPVALAHEEKQQFAVPVIIVTIEIAITSFFVFFFPVPPKQ